MNQPRPGLSPGERVPDFVRPDGEGRPFAFFERLCGQPVVLIAGGPDRALPADALAAISKHVEGLATVVGLDTVAERPPAERDSDVIALTDDGTVVRALLGTDTGEPVAIVTDRMMRVVSVVPAAAPTAAERIAAAVKDVPPLEEPKVVSALAPVLIVPDVLDGDLCREVTAAYEETGGALSGMPRLVAGKPELVPDPSVKIRRDHTIAGTPLAARLTERIGHRVLPEIRKSFFYPVTRFEAFKVVCYDAGTGGYFRPHRDNTTSDSAHRRFAMTLNLNTGDYRGGELRFPEYGSALYAPTAGSAIVFSCSHLHEVTDVTAGQRFALLTFFYGEQDVRRRDPFRTGRTP